MAMLCSTVAETRFLPSHACFLYFNTIKTLEQMLQKAAEEFSEQTENINNQENCIN